MGVGLSHARALAARTTEKFFGFSFFLNFIFESEL